MQILVFSIQFLAILLVFYSILFVNIQVSVPFGEHDDYPVSVSFIASHGADKFLLDTIVDMYSSLQDEVSTVSNSPPLPDINGNMETSELLKEKVYFCWSCTVIFSSIDVSNAFFLMEAVEYCCHCWNFDVNQG